MEKPFKIFREVSSFCDLKYNKKFAKRLARFEVKNQNFKWKKELLLV